MNRIEELRCAIDECDDTLVSIIAKRQALVDELSKVKAAQHMPVQVSQREQEIKTRLRALASDRSVAPDLIIDIIQRIMRDSYRLQSRSTFSCSTPKPMKVVIIGGAGQLGGLFSELFKRSGHIVTVLDKQDDISLNKHYLAANLVLLSLPLNGFSSAIEQLPTLDSNTILADLSSTKVEPVSQMMQAHSGPVMGLHPMFGPALDHVAQQLIICAEGRQTKKCQWLVEQMQLWGCKVQSMPAAQHDQLMSYIQGVRHLSAIVLGDLLTEQKIDISQLARVSTPAFRLELALLARLFKHHAELYIDIMLASNAHSGTLGKLSQHYQKWVSLLQSNDRDVMMKRFAEIAKYLDKSSPNLSDSSQQVLDSFLDSIKFSE